MRQQTIVDHIKTDAYVPQRDRRRLVCPLLLTVATVDAQDLFCKLRDVADGIKYLHSLKIVHGGIEPVSMIVRHRTHKWSPY
jgi:serine/threonine protein kinase